MASVFSALCTQPPIECLSYMMYDVYMDKSCEKLGFLTEPHLKNMFEEKTIGLTGPYSTHDALREGPKSLAAELSNQHPLQARFSRAVRMYSEFRSRASLLKTFEDQAIISVAQECKRDQLPSMNLCLDILTGEIDNITPGEIFGGEQLLHSNYFKW